MRLVINFDDFALKVLAVKIIFKSTFKKSPVREKTSPVEECRKWGSPSKKGAKKKKKGIPKNDMPAG